MDPHTPSTASNGARVPNPLGRDLIRASTQVLGNCAFIAHAGTPFVQEHHAEQIRRLDEWADELRRHPGGQRGETPGYPVPWVGLQGEISAALSLKYQAHVIHDDTVMPYFKDYR